MTAPFSYGLQPLSPLPSQAPPQPDQQSIMALLQALLQGQGPQPNSPDQTMGGAPQPPPGPRPFPSLMGIPSLPPPNAIPQGQALQPNTWEERAQLDQDAGSAGRIAAITGLLGMHQGSQNMQRGVAAGDPLQAVGGVAQGALSTVPVTRALAAPFRFGMANIGAQAAGSGDLSSLIASSAEAQAPPRRGQYDPAVEELQRALKRRGLYDGRVDGIDGDETRKAAERARAQDAEAATTARETRALESQRLQQQREAEETRKQERATTETRMQEVDRDRTFFQRYGEYLGWPLGMGFGYATRAGLGRAMGALEQRRTDRANALLPQPRGRADVNTRAGNINQFWTEGGGAPAPFSMTPGRRPYPFTPNANAVPANDLYPPSALNRYGPGAAMATLGGAELGIAHFGGVVPAREELAAAQAAVAADGSEANIQRLAAARNALASYSMAANFGRGQLLGGAGGELKAQLKYSPPRPNVGAAEGERGRLDQLIDSPASRRASQRAAATPAPAAATPAAPPRPAHVPEGSVYNHRVGRWQGPPVPGRPGRPFLPDE